MNRFKEARLLAHLSQKAAALSLGISAPSMSGWETGTSKPTLENLAAMAALYHVTTDYLLGVTDDPTGVLVGTEKEPAALSDDELREVVVSRIQSLPDPALLRVADFLDGLAAGRAVERAAPAAPDPAGQPGK